MIEIFAGILVLLLSGLFIILGIGGSSILIPIFYSIGISMDQARLAGLATLFVSTGTALVIYLRSSLFKKSDLQEIALILFGMLIAIPFGVWLGNTLDDNILIGLFSLSLFASAFAMAFEKKIVKSERKKGLTFAQEGEIGILAGLEVSIFRIALIRGAVGGGAGLATGMLGIGSGIFIMPSLILTGTEPKRAAILSVACMFVASLFSIVNQLAYYAPSDYSLMLICAFAALIGSYVGATLLATGRVKGEFIKKAFPLVLVALAIKLAFDFFA
ncbi:MAG: sulfite exporter TauE/SafE family protein [Candidatus Micrarchaeia archaeon]